MSAKNNPAALLYKLIVVLPDGQMGFLAPCPIKIYGSRAPLHEVIGTSSNKIFVILLVNEIFTRQGNYSKEPLDLLGKGLTILANYVQ